MVNSPATDLNHSIQQLGLRFNPFDYLESSADPHLGEYIVGHETFAVAWDETPALLFAPPGGGKTAMRIYTTRACWVGRGGSHPFPLSYYLPAHLVEGGRVSLEKHLMMLGRAAAASLLLGLVFRPERFLELTPKVQQHIVDLVDQALPGGMGRYLNILRASGSPFDIATLLDGAYILSPLPDPTAVFDLCVTLESRMRARSLCVSPERQFNELVELLLESLDFRSIFLLLDGVDAFPGAGDDPAVAIETVASIFLQGRVLAEQKIFIKAFLPQETEPVLKSLLDGEMAMFRQAHIRWTADLLAEVIRKRVYVASGGEFGSLDAVSSRELRDVELLLAKAAQPLPREVIVLAQRVLREYDQREKRLENRLESIDIEEAVAWYREDFARRLIGDC